MNAFTRAIAGSVLLHGSVFFGASVLIMEDAQFGMDLGESGAAGSVASADQTVQVEFVDPEPQAEPEPEPDIDPIMTDFELPQVIPKVREENRPEPKRIEAPQLKPSKISSVASMASAASPIPVASGSGGARVADKADYLRNPPPAYPSEAKKRGEHGLVVLRVELKESGCVDSLEVRTSSGHRQLDQAALDAVRRWRFQPAKVGGVAIASTVTVPIRFDLDKN